MKKSSILALLVWMACGASRVSAQPGGSVSHRPNWQNMDPRTDSIFGIGTEKAYNELLAGKTSKRVIVAVIDGGVDTLHEDLKSVLWVNPKPRKGDNGTYGWDYIGGPKGDEHYDNLELTRQVRQQQPLYEGKDSLQFKGKELAGWLNYQKEKRLLTEKLQSATRTLQGVKGFAEALDEVVKKIGKDTPTLKDFQDFQPEGPRQTRIKKVLEDILSGGESYPDFRKNDLNAALEHYASEVNYQLNIAYDPRQEWVGDDYFNSRQRDYGNGDVMGPDATHGTHVAGIIGADRTNGLGIMGVADNVRILMIRTVPDGDERDKDVANAIRYAADHGARVINMSFGKGYSQDKAAVDEAVKYALKKDVLLVQAAGNDNADIDTVANFPNRRFGDGGEAGAWIVVGASGPKDDSTLKAPFSNYGKTAVDVFAPGEQIYSSIPGSKYAYFDGTSMASPVVAGMAALIREYYPKLKATEVKDIILASAVKVDHPVLLRIGDSTEEVPFSELCRTGGIVNVYNALELAESRTGNSDGRDNRHKMDSLAMAVNSIILPVMKEYNIPGMAIGITINGKRYFYNFGIASRTTKRKVTEETLFEIGSISKTFTATLAAYAQTGGYLSLTDPVSKYLPFLRESSWDNIRLIDLATHTAGGFPLQLPGEIKDSLQLMNYYKQWRPQFPVGSYRVYANPGIGLLGVIAAHSMHQSFVDLIEKTLFPKLGLTYSYIDVPPEKMDEYAQGYNNADSPVRVNPAILAAETYGVKSCTGDLLQYAEANMQVVKVGEHLQQAISATHTGYFKCGVLTQDLIWEQYSYPTNLDVLLAGNSDTIILQPNPATRIDPELPPQTGVLINKTGSTNGFSAYILFIPAKKTGIVMLANKSYPIPARVRLVYRLLTRFESAH
jgi:CubicO group peptidase (beta-lactamase class C family)/subtilisin family serine protease